MCSNKELKRIRMEEDDLYVDVYYANAVDNLVCKLKRQLFTERAKRARTTQLLLMNAINHLESKYKHRFDNMRLQFHVWGVVKRKCKKYANKLLKESFRKCFEPQIFEEVKKQSTAAYDKKTKSTTDVCERCHEVVHAIVPWRVHPSGGYLQWCCLRCEREIREGKR
jgi:hypothetical protein